MMALWGKLKAGVLVALAFLAVLFGVWFTGRRDGSIKEQFQRKKDELDDERRENEEHVNTRQEKQDVQDTINRLPSGGARQRLDDGWMRGEDDKK